MSSLWPVENSIAGHPAIEIIKKVEGQTENQEIYVNPYTVSIYAIYLLEHDNKNKKLIKNYIEWYLSKTNYPDKFQLTGTIYDYIVRKNQEIPVGDYDSADAYSGIFLILVGKYNEKTQDIKLLKENLQKLKDIAYVIAHLQDPEDGLVRCRPDDETKYLLDNIEAAIGLKYLANLLKKLNDQEWKYYYEVYQSIQTAIEEELVDPKKDRVAWAKKDQVLFWTHSRDYPDRYVTVIYRFFQGATPRPSEWPRSLSPEQKIYLEIAPRIFR